MAKRKSAVFLINLVQDVNVLRPLIFMAARDFGMPTLLLVSSKFTARDLFGIWQSELEDLCEQTGADLELFADDWEAHGHLGGEGVIFAASESHLHNHVTTHSVFRHAPPAYLRVTLQHGFECVGFRHSAEHVTAHGPTASFAADFVCAWYDSGNLSSLAPSQAAKFLVTGPTAALQRPVPNEGGGERMGLICENLHSVRLNIAGDFKMEFVTAFSDFCSQIAQDGGKVALRPHPGGQYMLKNKLPLPPNATVNNAPMYRLNLADFAYGISAPSSVLIDMMFAGIPVAVWRDCGGDMDADNYAGLTTVSKPEEWLEFACAASADPEPFLREQEDFLKRQRIILDPGEVYSRFAQIFHTVLRTTIRPIGSVAERERILFVANDRVPTLQLSFEQPLDNLVRRGEITTDLLTEAVIKEHPEAAERNRWLLSYLDRFSPSVIIFCRYSGPEGSAIVGWAKRNNVAIIYHIDDDLLAIPPEVGERKHRFHNLPERLGAVRQLLKSADLVYASTERLRLKLLRNFPRLPVVGGDIYCSGKIIGVPRPGTARKVGYMASADHAHNLDAIVPALEWMMQQNPEIRLEFFGSVPIPDALGRFSDRIATSPAVADYSRFLEEFAKNEWDIGICPLSPIEFNLMKANTKWVEYSSVGAAVVASRGTVYDECCDGGCGLLADGPEEWIQALDLLINNPKERREMVERAQAKLTSEYSLSRLREQVLGIIRRAHSATTEIAEPKRKTA